MHDHQTFTSWSGAIVILCSAAGKHPPIAFYLFGRGPIQRSGSPLGPLGPPGLVLRCRLKSPIPIHRDSKIFLDKLISHRIALDPCAAGYAVAPGLPALPQTRADSTWTEPCIKSPHTQSGVAQSMNGTLTCGGTTWRTRSRRTAPQPDYEGPHLDSPHPISSQ